MVGTAQAADYSVFLKKVGYSVGLEDLYARSMEFGRAYSSVETFRLGDWSDLVREKWSLKSNHVIDVFASFGLMKIANREPVAGPVGESLGILSRLTTPSEYEVGSRYLILLALIENDGDIFLNALASSFEKDHFRRTLVDLISHKRNQLFQIFPKQPEREFIVSAVSIERQKTNKGNSSAGGLRSLERGRPLNERSTQLGLPRRIDIFQIEPPSTDYIEKATVTRRGWAESLGLFRASTLTDEGAQFLTKFAKFGYGSQGGFYPVWPTKFEIESSHFDPNAFRSIAPRSTIEFHAAIFSSLSPSGILNPAPQKIDALKQLLVNVHREYRSLTVSRSMIRNEVPLSVVSATAHAYSFATGSPLPQLTDLYDEELLRAIGFAARTSQTIELAISARRRDNKVPQ